MVRRVTLSDVASAAGVSTATVSYVLNDLPGHSIPEATRSRVRDAARELGYTRSSAARTLARGRSDIVLLLIPELPLGHVLVGIMDVLTRGCARLGLQLLARLRLPGEDVERLCREIMPAAVIVLLDPDPRPLAQIRALGVPVTRWRAGTEAPSDDDPDEVRVPTDAIGRLQAETLVAHGHTRLAFLGPADAGLRTLAEGRCAGVREYCAEHGLATPMELRVERGRAAPDLLRRLLAAGVTGVCVYNDDLALSVLAAAHAAMLSVPGDLAIIGVDDIPAGQWTDPPLTTVAFELDTISARILYNVARALDLPAPALDGAGGRELSVLMRGTVG